MRLKQSPKSKNIQSQEQTPNFLKKRNPEGNTGLKGDRLYNSPEYKAALNDISTQFRDKVNQRQGKSDRQPVGRQYHIKDWQNAIDKIIRKKK